VALPGAFTQSTVVVERHAAQPEKSATPAAAASCGRLECTCAKLRRCPPPAGSGHHILKRDNAASQAGNRTRGVGRGTARCVHSINRCSWSATPRDQKVGDPPAAAASCGRLECTCAKLRRCPPPAGSGHRVWPISVDTAASCAKRARTLQLPHERAMWHGISMLIPRDRNMLAGELPKAKSHICAHAVVNRRVPGSDDSVQAADARRMRGGRGLRRKQARACMEARAR